MCCGLNLILSTIVLSQQPAHPDVVERFAKLTCDTAEGPVVYRLYVPATSPSGDWPLVIWFHGRGEAGDDNVQQLAWLELIFGHGQSQKDVSAIVLAVQFAGDSKSRDRSGLSIDEMVGSDAGVDDPFQKLDFIVNQVIRRHPVDHQRIYLAGISLGASRCWQYAWRHPHRFAALLAMATGPLSDCAVQDLRCLPTWAFQSIADGPAQVQRMTRLCAELRSRGENARLSIVNSLTHDCWTTALRDCHAWEWLMDQRRGSSSTSWEPRFDDQYICRRKLGKYGTATVAIGAATLCGVMWRMLHLQNQRR